MGKKSFEERDFGAHMSIAGGLHISVERGKAVGCKAIQIFSKTSNSWRAKPITEQEAEIFKNIQKEEIVKVVAIHDSYLINLATHDPTNYKKSFEAFLEEVNRADILEVPYLVFHPGSHLGKGEELGLSKVADSLNRIFDEKPDMKVNIAIETTAGQGSNLGYRFEQIATIIEKASRKEKVSVCFDTCHVFASGYDFTTEAGYKETFDQFDKIIGLDKLALFHINDSKGKLSSRLDRHEHIGKGNLGAQPFRYLVNDPRFFDTPMILETPKGTECEEDKINLATLKSYIKI